MSALQQIGPYRVIRPLGQGGMGAVYLAHDSRLDRLVALKLLSGEAARSAYARVEILNEARAAAALNHPSIASVHDVLDVDRQIAIVFEYVEGENLYERLRRGRLGVEETIAIGVQLADALAAAHQHGVVHRDIKPANIALGAGGRVKVLDFGVARVMAEGASDAGGSRTTAEGFVGTMGYAAPEQCLGQSVDARADVFSLGVVLYEMLTQRRPFGGEDGPSIVRAMLNKPPERLRTQVRDVPAELDALVMRMLEPNPGNRPSSAGDVRDTLRAMDATTRADTVDVAPPRRKGLIVAVLAVALLTAAVVTTLTRRDEAPTADRGPVVAVLPLTNASGDPARDYVGVGVAEHLVTRLAGLSTVTVLSRSVVRDVQARTKELADLARELDVTYLIDGSVQQSGERMRIDLRLVERDGSVAWADDVEGAFEEVFDLQRRLTSAVVQALSVRLSAAERASLATQATTNPDALAAYWRGRALLDRRDIRGNMTAALAEFDTAIALDPRFADAHAARGETLWSTYLDTRDADLARAAVEAGTTALRLDPNRPEVRYTLAVTLAGTGQPQAAIEELQRALALRPLFEDARLQLGLVLARQGKVDEAVKEFRRVTDARPNYARPFGIMGFALFEAGRYADAAAAFERVTQLQPQNVAAYQQAGAAYHELGDLDRAQLFYERAIAVQPYAPAYSNLGTIYYARREYGKAAESYQKAISLRPNARETHRNLGDALTRLERRQEARRAYAEAVRLAEADLSINPREARILASLAVYQQKLQNSADATRRLKQALALAPTDFQVLRRAAQVYAMANQPQAALDALEMALANGLSPGALTGDDEFQPLRASPRFSALVNQYKP